MEIFYMDNTSKAPDTESYWIDFMQTGNISSYLMYKGIYPSAEDENKTTNSAESRGKSLGTY